MGFGPGKVRIRVRPTGLCHSGLSAMSGVLPRSAPFVPGHEGAGVARDQLLRRDGGTPASGGAEPAVAAGGVGSARSAVEEPAAAAPRATFVGYLASPAADRISGRCSSSTAAWSR